MYRISPIVAELPELPEPESACTKRVAAWVLCCPAQVLTLGKTLLHLNRPAFKGMVANFHGDTRPLAVTERAPWNAVAALPDVALGWVLKLEIRDDGLYAFVDFSEEGAAKVRTRDVRYCSPLLELDCCRDGERGGMKLHQLFLTSSP